MIPRTPRERGPCQKVRVGGSVVTNFVGYRVVDYQDTEGNWRNTDPMGQVTTDGSRMGQADPPPTEADIEATPWVNVGFEDEHGDITYKWIEGPFDSDFWITDAIAQIADEYGIVLGESA